MWWASKGPQSCDTRQAGTQPVQDTTCAVTTSWVLLFSTRLVTVSTSALRSGGLFVGTSTMPAAFFSAQANNLYLFSCFISGLYLWVSLSKQGGCLVAQGLGELVNCRRHLQLIIEDRPLSMQQGKISLGLDVLSITKFFGLFSNTGNLPLACPLAFS